MDAFKKLGLSSEFVKNLEQFGFEKPTEIQEKTIPIALAGKDIIAGSATGSGKTLAFGASIIEHLQNGKNTQALILTPTRELAEQVGKSMLKFSKHKRLNVAIVYGGVSISPQIHALERAEIVVGTPGRILDHMERGSIKFGNIKTLVLDEADRMLDMGFIDDVTTIVKACPKNRQTLLFSATISPDISHIAKEYMNRPEEISAVVYVDPSKLKQTFYDVPKHLKFSLLVHLLKEERAGLVMVFCNTRHNADFVGRNLQNQGIEASSIHGGLTQARRNYILEKFHSKKVFVLVCTDVAARGLDIPNVSHVYNYDMPANSKEYVHRIGRTARAGSEGKAISIVSERDYDNFRAVLRDQSIDIKQEDLPSIEQVRISVDRPRRFNRPEGRFGQRRDFRPRGRFNSRR